MPSMRLNNVLAAVCVLAAIVFSLVMARVQGQTDTGDARAPGTAQVLAPLSSEAALPAPSWVQQTGTRLADTEAPGRDLVALTQRLKTHSNAPVPSVVNATPPNYAVGARQRFNIADLVKKNYYTLDATLKYVTPHAYWYVKDGYSVDLNALKTSADYFDSHVYPTNRRIFGPEPSPGIDNDVHITVLLAPMVGLNGYFSLSDAYPTLVNPYSNQREMIYIGNRPEGNPADPENGFMATLAHEFQHMIHWNVHKNRDVWLDEGSSEIAMYLNGYDPGSFDDIFASQPDTQLNAWASEPGSALAHYGASYMFLRYLMDHYGGENFISGLLKQNGLGIDGIDAQVRKTNSAGFEGAFEDWLVANTLNNANIERGRYAYAEGGRAHIDRVLQAYPAVRGSSVHQYGADYIKLSGNLGAATVSFKGDSTAKVLPVDPHSGQAFWYSNRRDSEDATLTREFDLTRTRRATLQFWTWYDIEAGFDYAYVEASTDGGRYWTPLKATHTTADNPNGNSFGQAWTGKSGTTSSAGTANWVQESVNLSSYAGKYVQVRFEYVTDEGYNASGMAIDDLRVPEIGYSDNAETDNGWNAQGFVRIGNYIPQRWFVVVVENGSSPRVRAMTVNSTGAGSVDLAGFGSGKAVRDVTVIVSALAPKTTETAQYTLSVRKK